MICGIGDLFPPSFYSNSEEVRWILSIHSDPDDDDGANYGVNNFLGMSTWIIRFSDGNIEAEMMSSLFSLFSVFYWLDPTTMKGYGDYFYPSC